MLREPAAWLDRYHRALVRIWSAVEPFWTQAGAGIERDIERAAVAVARGATRELLAFTALERPVLEPSRALQLDHRGLVLIPQLSTTTVPDLRRREGDILTHVAYPLPGTERLVADSPGPPSSLMALLGTPRTLILRELDTPQTQGQLAERLLAVPSAATHHVAVLESAGLVLRRKEGRYVVVHRTARGTAMLALYEG